MDMNKPIKKMDDEELHHELAILVVLRNSLQRFIPQDEPTRKLLEVTEVQLHEAKIERNLRWGAVAVG